MGSLSDVLSVAIGLVLVFLLFSILTSYIQELIASVLNMRASNLANAVQLLLQPQSQGLSGINEVKKAWSDGKEIWDQGVTAQAGVQMNSLVAQKMNENIVKTFYTHPIIQTLSKPGKLPSYIPARDFTLALFDIFQQTGTEAASTPEVFLQNLHTGINALENNSLKGALLPLIQHAEISEQNAETKIAQARANVEDWFNATMERSTGWYKRRVQWIALGIALVVAFVFNADSIAITQSLWHDSALRQTVSSAATAYINRGDSQKADAALTQLGAVDLPVGWSGRIASPDSLVPAAPQDIPVNFGDITLKILGLLITALATSHGSGIWFDLLGRLVNIRSSGVKPAEESSPLPAKG